MNEYHRAPCHAKLLLIPATGNVKDKLLSSIVFNKYTVTGQNGFLSSLWLITLA
jgi:hypothetical protein